MPVPDADRLHATPFGIALCWIALFIPREGYCGMWKLAAVLGFTAVVIGRCGIEVFRLLQSQQACEMTYMYASYDVVKLETSCTSSRRPTNGVVLLPLQQPAWVEALEEAAARVGVAFETLGHTNYRLWRYTGDGHQGKKNVTTSSTWV